jgi:hypothetical protein
LSAGSRLLAEARDHHPDIDIRWNRVKLTLSTHSEGGLTTKDFALARQCSALSARQGIVKPGRRPGKAVIRGTDVDEAVYRPRLEVDDRDLRGTESHET